MSLHTSLRKAVIMSFWDRLENKEENNMSKNDDQNSNHKSWRTKSEYIARNVRIMSVDEPRELSSELTLCSFSFVDQPGNEKDQETWVRVTGANALAERIFNSKPGDRVNVSGKPFFRAYLDKEGNARCQVEIKYPDIDFLDKLEKSSADQVIESVTKSAAKVFETVATNPVRKPGRKYESPKKLPFEE